MCRFRLRRNLFLLKLVFKFFYFIFVVFVVVVVVIIIVVVIIFIALFFCDTSCYYSNLILSKENTKYTFTEQNVEKLRELVTSFCKVTTLTANQPQAHVYQGNLYVMRKDTGMAVIRKQGDHGQHGIFGFFIFSHAFYFLFYLHEVLNFLLFSILFFIDNQSQWITRVWWVPWKTCIWNWR